MAETDDKPARRDKAGLRTQVGALCFRHKGGKLEVLMITSRDTRRWIIPKGWPLAGKKLHEAAEIEAWEEAGVRAAKVSPHELGRYVYHKRHAQGVEEPCCTLVYPVEVKRLSKVYPERKERRRRWMRPKKAARLVDEPELRDILRAL